MQRDKTRVPASRRSARAGFAFKPAFLMLFLTIAATLAPSCGGKTTPVTTGTSAQRLQAQLTSSSKVLGVLGLEEPLVTTAPTSDAEDAAIQAAVDQFHALATQPRDDQSGNLAPFESFVSAHPQSGWASTVWLNLGLQYFRTGYFSKTFGAFQNAFELGKAATDWKAKPPVDRAFGELVKMHARVGHVSDLESLFAELGDRPLSGPATELVAGAREGLTAMHLHPEVAFMCGPFALRNMMLATGASAASVNPLLDAQSGASGLTLQQVADLATQVGLSYRLIYRAPGQAVPVPSVVNWGLHHYGAFIATRQGGAGGQTYVLRDPTFGESGELALSQAAVDAEASGFFLVPANIAQDPGWRDATPDEAASIYGMGMPSGIDQQAPRKQDIKSHNGQCPAGGCGPTMGQTAGQSMPLEQPTQQNSCNGMCGPDATALSVSLTISDQPVGHASPVGPPVYVGLTYNQREAGQPATFDYVNVSPKWTLDVLSYVQDDPANVGSNVTRYLPGGGYLSMSNYNVSYDWYTGATGDGDFNYDESDSSLLVRSPKTGTLSYYTLYHRDGSKFIYSTVDGATSFPRNVFLTTITDPQGNSLTFNYSTVPTADAGLPDGGTCPGGACTVLTSITDAVGRNTTFSYGISGNPLLVSAITDPFGRSASITYDGSGRLSTITDVAGITSTMGYDSGGLVNSLQTPYGTTTFAYGQSFDGSGNVLSRYLETTDPLSQTERLEYYEGATGISATDGTTPCCMSIYNGSLQYRDSYFWDKYVYPTYGTGAGKDYSKARQWHWNHTWGWANASGMLEATKEPLEDRIWYNSFGQTDSRLDGNLYAYTESGRISDRSDLGTTQLRSATYSGPGMLATLQDPYARNTKFLYATNAMDLATVQQDISGTYTTFAQYTWNTQHEPLTYVDAAGQTWRYCYNANGQLTQAIDPANYVSGSSCGSYGSVGTQYTYEGSSPYRLTSITNAAGNTQASFTYPGTCGGGSHVNCDVPSSITDSEGRSVSYTYDPLDRVTQAGYPDGTTDTDDYTFQSGTYIGTNSLDVRKHTDRLGRVTKYDFDANRKLTKVTDPLNNTVQYAYFANGKLNTLTDQNTNVTTWAIDIQGRPTTKTFADGKTITYAYSANEGMLHSVTDATSPTAQVKTYTYTYDNRLAGITYTNAVNTTHNVTWAFDANWPRITSMVDGNGTTTYSYVAIGTQGALKLLTEDGPYSNDQMTWAYDTDGRPNSLTVGGGTAETCGTCQRV